jgi:hypothetical protein
MGCQCGMYPRANEPLRVQGVVVAPRVLLLRLQKIACCRAQFLGGRRLLFHPVIVWLRVHIGQTDLSRFTELRFSCLEACALLKSTMMPSTDANVSALDEGARRHWYHKPVTYPNLPFQA